MADRDNMLQLHFKQGLNMANNRLENIVSRWHSCIMSYTKRNKIIYLIATRWLSLAMALTGIVQLLKIEEARAAFGPFLLLFLTPVTWYLRPDDSKVFSIINRQKA